MSGTEVDSSRLDQRIAAALQIDGRASWTRIAEAIGESERTVSRRGTNLLDSGKVRIRAMPNPIRVRHAEGFVVKLSCSPGTTAIAVSALAQRPEVLYAYMLTGSADGAAELAISSDAVEALVTRDLGAIPGVVSTATYPVLSYFTTMHQWRPPLLRDDEISAMGAHEYLTAPNVADTHTPPLRREDKALVRALSRDGRASLDELVKESGLSVQTVRKRVDAMRRDGTLYIRAVFEPVLLGLELEVMLWVKIAYPELDRVGAIISASRSVRYAAVLAGDYQLVVNAVFPDRVAFYHYLRTAEWVGLAHSIEPTVVVSSLKRSGVLATDYHLDRW